jgi:phage baseplate assembly protein W
LIVLDAFAIIDWLMQTPLGTRVEQRIFMCKVASFNVDDSICDVE